MRALWIWIGAALTGCSGGPASETGTGTEPPDDLGCTYPEGAVEPMASGEVLSPYSWPVARHRDGTREAALDLAGVPCPSASDEIDWSPFDVLLFVSIPAW